MNWPIGVGGKGSDGVAGLVSQTPGAFGYVELTYALQNKIATARSRITGAIRQARPSTPSPRRPRQPPIKMPADFRVSITNPPGKDAYPDRLVHLAAPLREPADKAQAKIMVDFMKWALNDGQKFAPDMGYAPLPKAVVDLELTALQKIKTQ